MPTRRIGKTFRQQLIQQDKQLKQEVLKEMTGLANDGVAWMKIVVARWKKKPRFIANQVVSRTMITVDVRPVGDMARIFTYIDRGTGLYGKKRSKYQIPKVPSPATVLRFRTGYSARTQPIARINTGTGRSSGPWRSARVVQHPGIKARQFTKVIWSNLTPPFRRRIENAFRRAERRAKNS